MEVDEIIKAIKSIPVPPELFDIYVSPLTPKETMEKLSEYGEVGTDLFLEPNKCYVTRRNFFSPFPPPEPLKPIFDAPQGSCHKCQSVHKDNIEEQIKQQQESIQKILDEIFKEE